MKTYFISNNVNNLIKIGKSRNVEKRVKELNGQIRFVELSVLYTIEGDYESQFHILYSAFRKEGEWFDIPKVSSGTIRNDFDMYILGESQLPIEYLLGRRKPREKKCLN